MVKMLGINDYQTKKEWGKDWTASCGNHGIVFSEKEIYGTAFFEIYPKNPDTFIRGEGNTIEEAEEKAWEQWIKIKECKNHEFERRNYTNGAGFCKHCDLFEDNVFEPLTKCVICGKPTYWTYDKDNNYYCKKHSKQIPYENLNSWSKRRYDSLKKDSIVTLKEIEEYEFEEIFKEKEIDLLNDLKEAMKKVFMNLVKELNNKENISEKYRFAIKSTPLATDIFVRKHKLFDYKSINHNQNQFNYLILKELEDISEEDRTKNIVETGREIYLFTTKNYIFNSYIKKIKNQ